MTIQSFAELDLIEPLQRALAAENYTTPTPIQAQAIPQLLKGRDLLGCAQTGTGKTAAFALPILQKLAASKPVLRPKAVRVLVLTPTRELALQINDSFQTYGRNLRVSSTVVMGGVGHVPQIKAISRGLDVLIATPGRLNDLLMQRHVVLDQVEVFVLDEADRMLDMGFIRDVRKIISCLPSARQTMLFSATMPDDIAKLAQSILKEPVRVEVTPAATTVDRILQKVLFVDKGAKHKLLAQVLKDATIARAIIFTRTKHGANKVGEVLERGAVAVEVIHGNKSQSARQKALENFRAGRSRVLVATDIAARGIDVDGITHVINFDLPNDPESYVHRIGRTARAGADGVAISFCDGTERGFLRDIEKLIRKRLPVEESGVQADARPQGERGQRDGDDRRRDGREARGRNGGENRHASGERQNGPRANGNRPNGAHPNGNRRPGGNAGGPGRPARRRFNRGSTTPAGAAA
jgi:ATP-dependent RNA helicase RhlE